MSDPIGTPRDRAAGAPPRAAHDTPTPPPFPGGADPDIRIARPGGLAARLGDPRTRRPLLLAGLGLFAVLLVFAIWQGSGTRRAEGDLRASRDEVRDKERQVEEARQLLEQRLAELQAARAEVTARGERLDVERVREGKTTSAGGEVSPVETEAEASLRRGDAALRTSPDDTPGRRP